MTIKRRIFSILLAIAMVATLAPWSSMKVSASFTGALQFDTAGKFTVMQVADIQDGSTVNSRVIALLTNAIARYHPDLVVFTGDNVKGSIITSAFKSSVDDFLAPLINTNTKFAVTFGNHDDEGTQYINKTSKTDQYAYYKSKGGSNFIDHDVTALSGVGSGVIPIYQNNQTSGTPAFQVYLMDSGTYASSGYDCPYTDQVDYYIQRSITYPNVPSLWYMHIIVPDVNTECMSAGTLIPDKINWTKSAYGTTLDEIFKEPPCPAEMATYTSSAHRSSAAYGSKTLYESWVAYGNMLGTYYGHDHKNSFVSTTDDGIDIGYGKAPTLNSYNDNNPGLRIFELDAGGTYSTFNVTESDMTKANLTFNANGGTGAMNPQLITKNTTAVLSTNEFAKTGYIFTGWSTSVTGSVAYTDGASYSIGSSDVVLYAKWIPSGNANITFDANGGIGGSGPTSMQFDSPLSAPPVSKIGYTLSGWSPSIPSTVPMVDTTYTAQWSANTCTVSYNSNGGIGSTANSSHSYDVSASLTLNGFTKTGYSFLGWSANQAATAPAYTNGQSVINLTPNPGVIITLYAVWSANQYRITFDANGGSGGSSEMMTYGALLPAPTVTKTGYTFSGWVPSVPAMVPSEEATYTAQWIVNSYMVTFDANGGEGSTSSTMQFGAEITAPTVTKTGCVFTGWSPSVPATVSAENMIYTAQWSANNVTVVFDADGGDGGTSTLMPYGTALIPPAVTKTGYTFAGWFPTVPDITPSENTIYTAQWIINSYTIKFNANGGTGGTTRSMRYGALLTAPTVTREGYTFEGWTPDVPETVPAANQTYVAQWRANSSIVTFDANGGEGGTSQLMQYGAVITAPTVLRTGYEFLGWSPAVDATVGGYDVTYTAQWRLIPAFIETVTGSTAYINPVGGFICGLEPGLTKAGFESRFMNAGGNGSLVYTPATGNLGTGTKVELIDNSTGEVLQTYYIVIFGDVNGDGNIDSIDAGVLVDFENGAAIWDSIENASYFEAADLNGDGNVDSIDAGIAVDFENAMVYINQISGLSE